MFPYILQISALVSGFIVHTLPFKSVGFILLVSKDAILINSDVTVTDRKTLFKCCVNLSLKESKT